jgi:diguanylate cyclase (GGDEF)-like protein
MSLHRLHLRRLALLCLLCASLNALGTKAQPLPDHPHYSIQHFGERFGLGTATILSMAQDSQGFLWIGTETGLFRYDGSGVTHFGRAEGLPGDYVELVLAAPDGSLWVRSRQGIARRLRERFETVELPAEAGQLRDGYQSFAVNQRGTVFVSTQNGLLRLQPMTRHYDLFRSGSSAIPGDIDAVARAANDTIWFAAGKQIVRFRPGQSEPENFAAVDLSDAQADERVVALLPAPGENDDRLWIRTSSRVGVLHVNAPGSRIVWLPDNLPAANIQGGPSLDHHGNLLLPTMQGLYWRDPTGDVAENTNHRESSYRASKFVSNLSTNSTSNSPWRVIDHRSGLTSSAVASALEDREGGIWIGTTGTGLDYWPGSKQWSGWTDAEGLPDALILGVLRDHRGRLWVAANTALCYWDPQAAQWRTVTVGGPIGARQIKLTPDGAVWAIIAGKGIYRFDANLEHPAAQVVPLPQGWKPHRITAAPDNSLWADGSDMLHVIRYAHGHFTVTELPAPAANLGTTRSVSISPGGVVWSAGAKGVSRYEHGRWQHFGKQDGLLADGAIEVEAVRDEETWLRYDDEGQITRLRAQASGAVDVMHVKKGMCGLGIDQLQNAWMAMDEGAGMISPDGKVRIFTEDDGLIWNDLNCGALWREADGSILLGTSKGLARYDAREEKPALPQPSIILTSVTFGKEDHLQDSEPKIEYKDATLLARFASPVFHNAGKVTCRYRLDGLETEFTETDLREARYSSLPAGDYTFQVSCGSPQLGQSQTASFSFTVLAPWWQTWWAPGSGILGFALLLWWTLWSRQQRDQREKERLERAVAERSAELAQANRELQETSLSDPLTGIRNRRFFQSTIAADASQAVRAYRGLANYSLDHRDLLFFLVDIDHFKEVNDQYGHDAGDRVLVQIAERLNTVVRESDFLIRWGGEEFLVMCRSAQRNDGVLLAARILKAINETEFALSNGRRLARSCSVGWAAFPWLPPACSDLSVDEVLRLADRGLYLAKERGRNQAVGLVAVNSASAIAAHTGHDKYCRLEQLLEDKLILEVLTPEEMAAGAAG